MLRHAEVHNPRDIVYGRLARFGLSTRGRDQAERAGRFLAARPIAAIYTSPLLRARQTAALVSAYHPNAPVRISPAVIEVKTGYQGSPNSILKPGFSFYHPRFSPEDETMLDVHNRMLRFVSKLARRHMGSAAVVVSHGDPIAILRLGLEGRELISEELHRTVYPARASLLQVQILPDEPVRLSYFDIVGDGPT